mgnify:CR=1 FL=1
MAAWRNESGGKMAPGETMPGEMARNELRTLQVRQTSVHDNHVPNVGCVTRNAPSHKSNYQRVMISYQIAKEKPVHEVHAPNGDKSCLR